MTNINYGIDLGTTNSGISKFENGKVTLFKNPVGFKDTLPSVVSFRKGRIQVGEKARELLATNTNNVFSSFKRKMGSDEQYFIPDLDKNITPIELSSMVLKELISFTPENEINSVVITIPASFDTIQTNATKKAGYLAGFTEVVMLQEPIAACLAYSNQLENQEETDKKWLVYDFGGGTFDVALVNINARELKVIDHKGNNFLGGVDLDMLLVEKIICTKIEEKSNQKNLWNTITSKENIAYNKLYFELLFKAEEAKKELSLRNQTTIEIEFDELDIFLDIEIFKHEFEAIIKSKFDESFSLTEKLVNSNNLAFQDIEKIILVGGTTYIPYIREELANRTNIDIDSSIDPTTAVIIGAGYYAGSKQSDLEVSEKTNTDLETKTENNFDLQLIYEPQSKDLEELIVGILPNNFNGYYRITRQDGGFDTGILKINTKISEFIPLLPKVANQFSVFIYNDQQNLVHQQTNIQITNGIYNVSGQPLPNDICIELDEQSGKTYTEVIFNKNDILPLKRTIYKTISKTILKNSSEKLIINIVEGNAGSMIGSNLTIGYIEVSGENFTQDLLKGMDVELNFKISESRDLSIDIFISSLDLEINEVFNSHQRTVFVDKLTQEIKNTLDEINREIYIEQENENYSYLGKLKQIVDGLQIIYNESLEKQNDFSSDKKYQLDEMKRMLIQDYDDMVRHKHVLNELSEYNVMKETYLNYADKASPKQKDEFEKITKNEKDFLQSNNKYLIKKKHQELEKLVDDIYYKQEESSVGVFYYFRFLEPEKYTNSKFSKKLVESGENALNNKNFIELKAINNQLYHLLIEKPKNQNDFNSFDGDLGLK